MILYKCIFPQYYVWAVTSLCLLMCQPVWAEDELLDSSNFKRPDTITFPKNAPYTPQKAALGKMLFFEPRISGAQNMSCATCHNPSFGWETPVARAIGALNQALDRHSPTVENLAEANFLFWDGRAESFEEQAREPITNPKEMNSKLHEVVARLSAIETYVNYFKIAFPKKGLTQRTILEAIATYERTLRSEWAPFDDWTNGRKYAISTSAKRGFVLFNGKANCSSCHKGWAFTDHDFHNVGIVSNDLGRGAIEEHRAGAFKTPSLRNIALRAPYMHNGSITSLQNVIEHYRKAEHGESEVEPLDLSSQDKIDLLEFLNSLTSYDPHIRAPALPVE